jgi:4-diphosphocytidyl-2-C-methyl-D-erythritol kinase
MLRAAAPAKVNLTLSVGPRAADGYHPVRSVFLRIGLSDMLAVEHAPQAAADELAVDGDFPCPVEGNLVLHALSLVRSAAGHPLPPLRAQLTKRIPVGAGMAGGSSDGAVALELAARAWGVGLAPAITWQLQAALGSDVSFFARGVPAALIEGRGERVAPLPGLRGGGGLLLCVSTHPLMTAAVYARYDQLSDRSSQADAATDELVSALQRGLDGAGLAQMARALHEANDLWPAAVDLAPELRGRRDRLESVTGRPWLMTGSGPTLFALYASHEQAADDARRLAGGTSLGPDILLIATDLKDEAETWRKP